MERGDVKKIAACAPYTTLVSLPSFNMNKADKEKKGHFHAIKNHLSPSSSKPPSQSGLPIPRKKGPWSLREIFGNPPIAPTQPTWRLPPPLSDNPIPESPLSTYPIISQRFQEIIASRFNSRYVPEWSVPVLTSWRIMGSPKTLDISAPKPLATPLAAGTGDQTWGCLWIVGTDWFR